MVKIILETDLGRDPDDLWALLYLISTGADIAVVTIAPGDQDQIAIAQWLREELELDFLIGSGLSREDRRSCRGWYHQGLLEKYGYSLEAGADGSGPELIRQAIDKDPDCEFIVIGPLTSLGAYLQETPGRLLGKATMHAGGFIAYDEHGLACERVDAFLDKSKVQTFNLNASKESAFGFLEAPFASRSFVGKHVCHRVIYGPQQHEQVMAVPPRNRAAKLFRECMTSCLATHPEGKRFHDPLAAVCHLHPDITTWVTASLYKEKGEWGARLDENGDNMIVDFDSSKFWRLTANAE